MENTAALYCRANRLKFARSPAAFFAGAALNAMRDAGIPDGEADFIVVAVPAGDGPSVAEALLETARAAPSTVGAPGGTTA